MNRKSALYELLLLSAKKHAEELRNRKDINKGENTKHLNKKDIPCYQKQKAQ